MVKQELRVKVEIEKKKVIFSGISCRRVIGNSIQFLHACKILSSKDKKGKNKNRPDFPPKILK
jgi:hypothetical protein